MTHHTFALIAPHRRRRAAPRPQAMPTPNTTAPTQHRVIAARKDQQCPVSEAIDQAKGALMAQHGWNADQAFAELVRRSQHESVKLTDGS